jgi:hypothetical protein
MVPMYFHSVLHFWFTELTPTQHFVKDPALDEAIRTRFGATLEAAARCEAVGSSLVIPHAAQPVEPGFSEIASLFIATCANSTRARGRFGMQFASR